MNFFLFLLMLPLMAFSQANEGLGVKWEEVRGANAVKVFAAEIAGSDVVAFRGESVIEAPLIKLVAAFYNMERKREWMHDLKEIKILRYSNRNERVEYYLSKTPWPLDDRDFVYRAKFFLSPDKKTFDLLIENAQDPAAPERESVVRGTLQHSYYQMVASPDGKSTKIVVEILADPKGFVPKWLVNIFQRSWPVNTISGLRSLVTDSTFKIDPIVKEYFEFNAKNRKE